MDFEYNSLVYIFICSIGSCSWIGVFSYSIEHHSFKDFAPDTYSYTNWENSCPLLLSKKLWWIMLIIVKSFHLISSSIVETIFNLQISTFSFMYISSCIDIYMLYICINSLKDINRVLRPCLNRVLDTRYDHHMTLSHHMDTT